MFRLLPLAFLLLISTNKTFANNYKCGQIEDQSYKKTHTLCDQNGNLIEKRSFFKKTGTLASVLQYKNNKLRLKRSYNTEEELVQEFYFEYPFPDQFFKISYKKDSLPKVEVSRQLFEGSPESSEKTLLENWVYESKDNKYELKVIDHHNGDLISKREVFEASGEKETYIYTHPKLPSKFKYVDSFRAYSDNGLLIKSYSSKQSIDVRKYSEEKQKSQILHDQKRRRMMIVDTGFDVSHQDFSYKFHLNSKDPIDGIDNDGNGIVDDLLGWSVDDDGNFSNNINEFVSVKSRVKPYKPFSHGTHVASIALSEVEGFSITAFAGDMSNIDHINMISNAMSQEEIEFVNMSFSFGDFQNPLAPGRPSFIALEKMIRTNDQVVFSVAAGNAGQNLDGEGLASKEYPASFKNKNILSVGALDTDLIEEFRMPFYRPTHFSAYGIESVDIFAPGQDVDGAAVGGGRIRVSGTSMAAPFALNLLLKIALKHPSLSPLKLKDILLYSAYIPNLEEPLDCTSGGMIFPRRAFEVAKYFSNHGGSIRDSALKVRSQDAFLLPEESSHENYLNKLKNLWKSRGL